MFADTTKAQVKGGTFQLSESNTTYQYGAQVPQEPDPGMCHPVAP
jgi:hypothetical protein